jgi:hypothetical protein
MRLAGESGMRFPVSVKGVLLEGDQVVLLLNERDEWELPSGRIDCNTAKTRLPASSANLPRNSAPKLSRIGSSIAGCIRCCREERC